MKTWQMISNDYMKFFQCFDGIHAVYFRPATWFQGLVLVYYYTVICDVTVTKYVLKGLDLPFKGPRSRKNCM